MGYCPDKRLAQTVNDCSGLEWKVSGLPEKDLLARWRKRREEAYRGDLE